MHLNYKYLGTLVCYGNRGTYQPTRKMRLCSMYFVNYKWFSTLTKWLYPNAFISSLDIKKYLLTHQYKQKQSHFSSGQVCTSISVANQGSKVSTCSKNGVPAINSTLKINFSGEYILTNWKLIREYFKTVLYLK